MIELDYLVCGAQGGATEMQFILQGRRIQPGDLAWLRGCIDRNPDWSRKRIAREVCQHWQWVDGRQRDVGCLLFGAAAWRCAPRDRKLGWSSPERAEQLGSVVNNTRFLVLPWVRVKHLASCLLGAVARRIDADWRQRYGHGVDWLETFVDRDRFQGTCYRAANWEHVGQTQGRSRQDRHHELKVPLKDVYLYDLKSRRSR